MVPSALGSTAGGGGGGSCRKGLMRDSSSCNARYLSTSHFSGVLSSQRLHVDGRAKTVDEVVEVSWWQINSRSFKITQ